VIRGRINDVDRTLHTALSLLDEKSVDVVAAQHGRALFERADVARAMDFHTSLKARFGRDLATLGVALLD
jgi:hypothetical protein